jgi:hypothetical protein
MKTLTTYAKFSRKLNSFWFKGVRKPLLKKLKSFRMPVEFPAPSEMH